jgi:hypothetical protein
MPTELRPEIKKLFLSLIEQPGSFAQPNAHTALTYHQQTGAPRGAPDATWVEAGSNQIASIPIFGIILDANVGPYGTADNAKSLDVRAIFNSISFSFSSLTSLLHPCSRASPFLASNVELFLECRMMLVVTSRAISWHRR